MKVRSIVPYAIAVAVYAALFFGYRAVVPAIENSYRGPRPEFRRFAQLNEEARHLSDALREVMLRDSILPLIPATPGIVSLLPDSGSAQTTYLRRLVQREAQRDVDVAIPVIGVPTSYGIVGDIPESFSTSRYYAGERAGGAPFCAVAVPYSAQPRHNAATGSVLGPCKVWARHGAPGPHIREWMTNTRGEFALDETAHIIYLEPDMVPFARRFGSQFWGSFESRRCRAGDDAACERAVTAADSSAQGFKAIAMKGDRWYMPRVAPGDATLLADLEKQYGTERFRRFWTSQEPVGEAFQAAFGVALGEWVYNWSEERYGPITIGARMKLQTILLSLIFIGLFTALAVATVRGRRI